MDGTVALDTCVAFDPQDELKEDEDGYCVLGLSNNIHLKSQSESLAESSCEESPKYTIKMMSNKNPDSITIYFSNDGGDTHYNSDEPYVAIRHDDKTRRIQVEECGSTGVSVMSSCQGSVGSPLNTFLSFDQECGRGPRHAFDGGTGCYSSKTGDIDSNKWLISTPHCCSGMAMGDPWVTSTALNLLTGQGNGRKYYCVNEGACWENGYLCGRDGGWTSEYMYFRMAIFIIMVVLFEFLTIFFQVLTLAVMISARARDEAGTVVAQA